MPIFRVSLTWFLGCLHRFVSLILFIDSFQIVRTVVQRIVFFFNLGILKSSCNQASSSCHNGGGWNSESRQVSIHRMFSPFVDETVHFTSRIVSRDRRTSLWL
ncbi:hypothetical protein Syun_001009 [Stephania yunnanensis]|uniref:Uncharacterized protein n=1 Tax=Stephania yunnanensis TaxID=152371 RepID=A0AAP0LH11_9MAGN